VYGDDPLDVARRFAAAGAQRVHVVDLDAARGSASNAELIGRMLQDGKVELQIAGGIRTEESVTRVLGAGAQAVVMATAAIRDPHLFEKCAFAHPGQVIGALDIREDKVHIAGWLDTDPVALKALMGRWADLPLAGVIVTSIDRDGTMRGPDLETLGRVRKMTRHDLLYSGGISSVDDMRRVFAAGAAAVILGKALYEGRVRLEEALEL
jgi:phosphoribosylformimino-5-aminoimidazole carboxamide ribotide isomerase